jgi:hypothetical protein
MTDQIQHQDKAQGRLAVQFRDANLLIGYIRALLQENEDLEQVFQDILSSRTLDTATGEQLEIIGEIVGVERGFSESLTGLFFGFATAIGAGTFGTEGDSNVGENFRSVSDSTTSLQVNDDEKYRRLIRSKILKNKTNCNINDIIEIALIGVVASGVTITETDKEFTVTYNSFISDEEKLLLTKTDYMVRPAGVRVLFADAGGPFT